MLLSVAWKNGVFNLYTHTHAHTGTPFVAWPCSGRSYVVILKGSAVACGALGVLSVVYPFPFRVENRFRVLVVVVVVVRPEEEAVGGIVNTYLKERVAVSRKRSTCVGKRGVQET